MAWWSDVAGLAIPRGGVSRKRERVTRFVSLRMDVALPMYLRYTILKSLWLASLSSGMSHGMFPKLHLIFSN